jgi:hypothetical protein
MKKIAVFAALIAVVGLSSGCVTSKKIGIVTNPDGTSTTNITVVVNEANLALDCAAIQAATAVSVNAVRIQSKNDPGVISALKNAKTALDGILLGANQQTTDQVLTILKANGNPELQQQVSSLVQTISTVEQALLQKYGTTVKGEITLSILKSIDAGLAIGLAGA